MSDSVEALLDFFIRTRVLNEQILLHLEQGTPTENLATYFESKAQGLLTLQKFDLSELQKLSPASADLYARVLEAQRRCAQSEEQLCDALGERQKGLKIVSAVTSTYGVKNVDNLGIKGVDFSG